MTSYDFIGSIYHVNTQCVQDKGSMMKKLIAVMLVSFMISGCGQDDSKSVDFYKSNAQVRKDTLEKCVGGDASKDCKNAEKAQSETTSKIMKSLYK